MNWLRRVRRTNLSPSICGCSKRSSPPTAGRRIVNSSSGQAAAFADVFRWAEWVRSADPGIVDTYVARYPGGLERTVVMLGHHNTVYAERTTATLPFRIKDGRATGPGVTDMKGGVVLGCSPFGCYGSLASSRCLRSFSVAMLTRRLVRQRRGHSPDEWLDVASLPARMALVTGLIAQAEPH